MRGSDEKKKKKGGKKELPAGQKTLDFFKKAATSSKTEEKKNPERTPVNPADFFKNSPGPASKPLPPSKIVKQAPKPAQKPSSSTTKISPSAKENTKAKAKKVSDDEFMDSDDSFESFTPITVKKPIPKSPKKETNPVEEKDPVKKETPKKKTPEAKKADPKKEVPKVISASSTSSQVSTSSVDFPAESKQEPVLSWVDKYKPTSLIELVGQNGEKSPMNKLMDWLRDWAKHNLGEGAKIKKRKFSGDKCKNKFYFTAKPAAWAASTDGTPFKAALLSGTPGVGKTTCAYMACKQLNLQLVEMNASDVRNKKHLEAKIGELSGSHQIEQFFGVKKCEPQDNNKVHHVLIMDEVDGMSGNADRAGVSKSKINSEKLPRCRSLN